MRIAHVVDSMDVGGAEMVVAMLCRRHRDAGHEVSVHAHLRMGPLGEQLRREGFRVDLQGPAKLPFANRNFYRLFREIKPEVVHCHNPTPTMYAAPAARMAGARRVISTRHSLVAPPHSWKRELKYGAASRFCDAIIGVCEITCANTKAAPFAQPAKVRRVYNGVEPLIVEADAELPAKSGFTVVYVGRLAPVKGLGTLIRAYAEARKQVAEMRLWIVGDGPSRAELEALTRELGMTEGVTFFGEQMQIARFFKQADVFAMSSVSEGLPMSLLQAMSMGLPAVVTDVGGMAEVVRMSEGGLTSAPADPGAMAQALLRLRGDAELRRRLGAQARDAFYRDFTAEHMAVNYLKLYEA